MVHISRLSFERVPLAVSEYPCPRQCWMALVFQIRKRRSGFLEEAGLMLGRGSRDLGDLSWQFHSAGANPRSWDSQTYNFVSGSPITINRITNVTKYNSQYCFIKTGFAIYK